ncbi:hypothetical protein PSTG_03215 [Puccinia striiformis f. sp. tritici PST-78]|uniref:Uncharacterized protein n=1 Tax=Puccinia striiformis f. sp. tritici PST-78 TaxID=1165861 RepID=A0A0L0VWK1_9BASI|nr:hypothetical protein PSTG_03215 [Puccinia striiformis f. sp. tritici PST-78]
MVRYSKRKACIKALENTLENNFTSQAIMDALGANDDDSSNKADSGSSLDEEDLNTDLMFYLQAVHSQQYFGPHSRLALAPTQQQALVNRLPRIGVLTPKHTQRPGDSRVDVAVWSSGQDFGPPVFWEWELQNLQFVWGSAPQF